MPTISVIVPVYNVEKYIHRCVDSILSQTFTDFELILVDDGSPDNCGAICEEYAAKDSRVVVIHQKNGGLSAARNAGIDWAFANSDSQWLTFIDSDDWVHPAYLDRLINAADTHGVKISMCGLYEVSCEERMPQGTVFSAPVCMETEEAYVTQKYSMTACGKLYVKESFLGIRYPVGKLHEDVATTYKALFRYSHTAVDASQMYYYRQNQDSITHRKWHPGRLDEISGIEEQIAFFSGNGMRKAEMRMIDAYYWVLANHLRQMRDEGAEIQYVNFVRKRLWRAIRKYRKIRPLIMEKDAGILEQILPEFMKTYWLYKAARRKMS